MAPRVKECATIHRTPTNSEADMHSKARTFFLVSAGIFVVALSHHLGAKSAAGQGTGMLVSITDYPRLQYSAVAVDQAGGIYFGHLQQWSRVGTTPSEPAAIWSRSSDGGITIALKNGDVYGLGSPALPVGDWTLTYDSN